MRKHKIELIILFFVIVFISLAAIFPLTVDDIIYRLLGPGFNFVSAANGRYLGNFLGVNLAYSIILRVVIKTIVIIGIIFMIKKISNVKSNNYILLIISLLLFMPKELFRETMVFTVGFTTYIIPIIGILFIIHYYLNNVSLKSRTFIGLFCFLGIFNSLFVEHLTLFNLILSIFLFIQSYLKTKKINPLYLAYLIGSLVGTVIMFSNHNYILSFIGQDNHQYRTLSSFNMIGEKLKLIVYSAIYVNNIINFAIIVLISLLHKNCFQNKSNLGIKSAVIFLWLFAIYNLLTILNPNWQILNTYTYNFNIIITSVYIILIIYLLIFSKFLKREELKRLMFYIVSIAVILLPLIVVNPLSSRCYIMPYILMIILVIDLFKILEKNKIISIKKIENILILIVLMQCIFYLTIYGNIHIKYMERINYVNLQKEQNREIIKIKDLPYQEYLHYWNICYKYFGDRLWQWENYYKFHYKINSNKNIEFENC